MIIKTLKQNLRWIPIALLLLIATLTYTLRAPQTPCRVSPQLCQPDRHPPPCQPLICPDANTRETRADHTRRPL